MKKLILVAAIIVGISSISTAQHITGKITLKSTDDYTIGRIGISPTDNGGLEYETQILECRGLNEVISYLPSVVRIVEGMEGHIEISYPKGEAEYLDCKVMNDDTLVIGRNTEKEAPKNLLITEKSPIVVVVSSTTLGNITNTSDMSLHIEHDAFDKLLKICNNSGLFVHADSISSDVITIINQGTMTCYVKTWNANDLMLTNAGYLFIEGVTTAQRIEHSSAGIDNTDLTVACRKLEVISVGSGIIKYRGTADDVMISSMGDAMIRTSELNKEQARER